MQKRFKKITQNNTHTQCQPWKRLAWPIMPDMVLSGKGYHLCNCMWSLWGIEKPFFCALGLFRHGDNWQPCDHSASLLLTSEKAVFCNCERKMVWKNLKSPFLSGVNTPRGGLEQSNLPSARKVSWDLHHDVFKFGKLPGGDLGSDPTCSSSRVQEFNQRCPNGTDKSTGARLGGNGALATHMVATST